MTKTAILKLFGLLALVIVPLFVFVGATRAPAHVPVGYYDGARVYGGSREAKAARDAVDAKTKNLLTAAQNASAAATQAEKDKAADAEAKNAAARAAVDAYQKAGAEGGTAVATEIDKRIAEAVARIAAARGMTLVLAISGKLPYAAPECDLTPDIVVAVDASGPVK